jgi:IS30 family transposase
MGYTQLTKEQRYTISAMRKQKKSQTEIAETIGVSQSTISRELQRNGLPHLYQPVHAQAQARKRRARDLVFNEHDWLPLVEKLKKAQWSPEQIVGRFVKEGKENIPSVETFYQYIYRDKKAGGDLWKNLRRKRKKRRKRLKKKDLRGSIPNRVGIENRPKEVETKAKIGHWEGDTVVGAGHKQAFVTVVERHSKYLVAAKVEQATAKNVAQTLVGLLKPHAEKVETLTFDNGQEFSAHQKVSEELNAEVYFARPYHSWERGLNEHTNGLLRQYFPKKTLFETLTQKEIRLAVQKINQRPRKILGYRTPEEVFFSRGDSLETLSG